MFETNLGGQCYESFPNQFQEEGVGPRLSLFWLIGLVLVILELSLVSRVGGHAGMDPEIHEITEHLEMEPDRVDLWIQRGQVYRSYGRYDESLQDLEKAGELEPGNNKVVLERGLTLSAMGRYTRSRDCLRLFSSGRIRPETDFCLG